MFVGVLLNMCDQAGLSPSVCRCIVTRPAWAPMLVGVLLNFCHQAGLVPMLNLFHQAVLGPYVKLVSSGRAGPLCVGVLLNC